LIARWIKTVAPDRDHLLRPHEVSELFGGCGEYIVLGSLGARRTFGAALERAHAILAAMGGGDRDGGCLSRAEQTKMEFDVPKALATRQLPPVLVSSIPAGVFPANGCDNTASVAKNPVRRRRAAPFQLSRPAILTKIDANLLHL
jgi:hypothetical protein